MYFVAPFFQDNVFVKVSDPFPQNKHVGYYCPSGYRHYRHVCGSGANAWNGTESVQYGPYMFNKYLGDDFNNHCLRSCDCSEVMVECSPGINQYY